MIADIAFLILFGGIGVIFAWNVKGAIFDGLVHARFTGINRSNHPIAFWTQTALSVLLTLVCFFMAALSALDLLGAKI